MNLGRILIILSCISVMLILALYVAKDSHTNLYQAFLHPTATRTFAMIKPDAVAAKDTGKIIDMIESQGFTIVAMKKMKLTPQQAAEFYAVHKERPFYTDLITFMTSGPIVALVLEKENAIQAWRDLIGATDPQKAAQGTIRQLFGTSTSHNAVHGSDSASTAQQEIALIFPELTQR